jgi:hypothetical protein
MPKRSTDDANESTKVVTILRFSTVARNMKCVISKKYLLMRTDFKGVESSRIERGESPGQSDV